MRQPPARGQSGRRGSRENWPESIQRRRRAFRCKFLNHGRAGSACRLKGRCPSRRKSRHCRKKAQDGKERGEGGCGEDGFFFLRPWGVTFIGGAPIRRGGVGEKTNAPYLGQDGGAGPRLKFSGQLRLSNVS